MQPLSAVRWDACREGWRTEGEACREVLAMHMGSHTHMHMGHAT